MDMNAMGTDAARAGTLQQAAQTMGVDLAAEHAGTLLKYAGQLQRWNRVYNLTALKDADQVLVQHLIDSLSIVAPLRAAVAARQARAIDEKIRVVDVGSGAGLPGIVIAITNPGWDVSCVDAVGKKMAFVRQMCGALALPNLHAIHSRIEALSPLGAGIVVSRAFSSLAQFATLAGKHVAPGGWLVAMKGHEPREELVQLAAIGSWTVPRVQPIDVPGLGAARSLVWLSPVKEPYESE
jgi:16S rRNA (guanine527-N7)-methyltransferase